MFATATNTLADRFAWLIDGLCKAIGGDAHSRRMDAALAWAIWNRVRLLGDRLIALAARVRAGKNPVRRAAEVGVRQGSAEPIAAAAPRVPNRLPREFGWIRRLLPETAQYAGVLRYLLRDPETAALVEQAPQAGRILRPLCHLLGVQPPDFLRRSVGAAAPPQEEPPAAQAPAQTPPLAEAPLPAEPPPQPPPAPVQAAPAPPARPPPGGLAWDHEMRRWIWL